MVSEVKRTETREITVEIGEVSLVITKNENQEIDHGVLRIANDRFVVWLSSENIIDLRKLLDIGDTK